MASTPLYTPRDARNMGERDARREYSRLRDIARKRLQRMSERGHTGWYYQKNKDAFPYTRDLSYEQLQYKLAEISDFLTSPFTTVRGWTATVTKGINTLQRHGYNGINAGNIQDFGRFMAFYRASSYATIYSSKRIAKMYSTARRTGRTRSGAAALLKAWDAFQEDQRS